jgi:hypothetical protein
VEVQGIADGEVAKGIKAYNPIIAGQLTREEIERSSKDVHRSLQLLKKRTRYINEGEEKTQILSPFFSPPSFSARTMSE